MKKRTGIIGLGTISKYYMDGIRESSILQLCAVCDLVKDAPSKECYKEYLFYTDYKEMIAKEQLDYVIISTPPATHNSIATYALENSVNVIIEKPAVLDMSEYDELVAKAKDKDLIFETMFHWQYGSEIICFNQKFDISKISSIKIVIFDPYSKDGKMIDVNKEKLEGVWLDSGINALSVIKMWLLMEEINIRKVIIKRCERTNIPIYIDLEMQIDNINVNIQIDWRQQKDYKCIYLTYDGKELIIENSLQKIMNEKEVYFECSDVNRLSDHYYNYFKNFRENSNNSASRKIHQILLEVVEFYEKSDC